MKPKITILFLFPLVLCSFTNPKVYQASSYNGKAYASSEMMDFSDLSEEEINNYYSSISNESYGTTFINEIYDVISQNNFFISYGSGTDSGVNRWYKITDRNWELSREISPSTYKFADDNASNYYLSLLYFEDNTTKERAINSYVNGNTGWAYDSSLTYVDYDNKKKNNLNIQQDKEHIWAKSHGINSTGDPQKGAGTDLHHLLAADHKTNNIHNNNDYGYIDRTKSFDTIYCYYANGDTDISGWSGVDKYGNSVFEPSDTYKGDIARALLYMATRYSKKLDTNTEAEPYLQLTDDITLIDDMSNYHGVIHNLSDLLEWNELDPVSNYEIHRNNLIYNNVQRNRNPYIDHPEWARRAFDEDTYLSESNFSNLKASYNLHVGTSYKLPIIYSSTSTIKVEYDSEYIKLDDDNLTITPLKESNDGSVEIKFIEVTPSNKIYSYETKIYIENKPSIENTNLQNLTISENETINLTYKLNNSFSTEKVKFVSLDESIAKIDNYSLKGIKEGSVTIEAYLVGDQEIFLDSFQITITKSNEMSDTLKIIIGAGAVVLLFIVAFLSLFISKKRKKKKAQKAKIEKTRKARLEKIRKSRNSNNKK